MKVRKSSQELCIFLLLALMLAACGESSHPTTYSFEVPTAPPTPGNYEGVPNAATISVVTRQPVANSTPVSQPTPDDSADDGVSGPGDNLLDQADPTALARLFASPGAGYRAGSDSLLLTPGAKGSGQPSRPAPTPTLNTSPDAVRIDSLRTTQVTFLTAYRQAAAKVAEASRSARLVFASANILKPEHTVWSFLFIASEGPRMWRVIYDSEGSRLDLREVAPSATMADDIKLIDMSKVLDGPALLAQASSTGLSVTLPVDIVTFQVEGLTKQPCFIFTNVAQGKQVALHAYTGQVLRNDFGF
jgi:hypothetical protein